MRLLVTGAGGGLGRAFRAVVPAHHDVVAAARLQDQINLDSADFQVGEGAVVGHFEDVRAD